MQQIRSLYSLLGFLRFNLISFAYGFTFLHLFDKIVFNTPVSELETGWGILILLIVQLSTPLFIIVMFLDFLMTKVKATDAEGQSRLDFQKIITIERWSLWVLFAYWFIFFYGTVA